MLINFNLDDRQLRSLKERNELFSEQEGRVDALFLPLKKVYTVLFPKMFDGASIGTQILAFTDDPSSMQKFGLRDNRLFFERKDFYDPSLYHHWKAKISKQNPLSGLHLCQTMFKFIFESPLLEDILAIDTINIRIQVNYDCLSDRSLIDSPW